MKKHLALALSLLSSTAVAGQIELKNGTKIEGMLKSVDAKNVVWQADKVGDVTVNKGDVANMTLNEPVKLQGITQPCDWQGLQGINAQVDCAGDVRTVSLLTLEDVVPFRAHQDALHSYQGKLTLVGSEKSGNVNSSNWLASSEVNIRQDDFRHDFELRYTGESQEIEFVDTATDATITESVTNEYYLGAYGLDWFFQPRWYLLGDLNVEKDDAKQIIERYVLGLGSGFQWWESNKTALKLELSAEQAKERYDLGEEDIIAGTEKTRDYAAARLAADYRYKFPRDIAYFARGHVTQNLDESDDYRSRIETGVSAPLGIGISAAFNVEYDYINNPPEDVEKGDTTYRLGVTYTW